MNTLRTLAATAATMLAIGAVRASLPEPVDLASFGETATPAAGAFGDLPLQDVAVRSDPAAPRFYVSGILGASSATLAEPLHQDLAGGSLNGSIATAGGAAGVAYARDHGQWRFEVEGRGRDDLTDHRGGGLPPFFSTNFGWAAADGWSLTANVWRDWWVGERWAVYAGGGLGGGGYRYSFAGDLEIFTSRIDIAGNDQVAELAWQAGGGVVYEITERISFDVGYRFFSIGQSRVTYTATLPFEPPQTATLTQQFTASEVLFALRIYEPFRHWR